MDGVPVKIWGDDNVIVLLTCAVVFIPFTIISPFSYVTYEEYSWFVWSLYVKAYWPYFLYASMNSLSSILNHKSVLKL